MPSLFDPLKLGALTTPNRIFMAPLTRGRATRDHVPTALQVEYYRQRASAGLIFTEATGISLEGLGWPYAPGLWTDAQVEGWTRVTDAVHDAGGRIVAQLWHMGRLVHPSMPGRAQPVAASAITAPGEAHTYEGKQPYVEPRPLRTDEMPRLQADYRHAAENAKRAGFDGVMLHAANGYLIDEFLRDGTNHRTDEYGGSIENRIRLLVESTRTLVDVWGKDRVGVRLSPNGEVQGVNDANPQPLFVAAARALSQLGIAYIEIREPRPDGTRGKPDHPPVGPAMREAFVGTFIVNSDYDEQRAQAALDAGLADAVTFGRPFISNPDLPRRFSGHVPLAEADEDTFYTHDAHGYTDYPSAE